MKNNPEIKTDNDIARDKFINASLSYEDIAESDFYLLLSILSNELQKYTSPQGIKMKISNRIKRNQPNIKLDKNSKMEYAHIKVDSHYFEGREAISFNRGGWIGFAGWASTENIKPFCKAFCEWIDVLKIRRGKR